MTKFDIQWLIAPQHSRTKYVTFDDSVTFSLYSTGTLRTHVSSVCVCVCVCCLTLRDCMFLHINTSFGLSAAYCIQSPSCDVLLDRGPEKCETIYSVKLWHKIRISHQQEKCLAGDVCSVCAELTGVWACFMTAYLRWIRKPALTFFQICWPL